ncbi:MAG: carboxylating nicotinate-nucleotide diphosphorylase [Alphaproteobacteria bacterium]|nr:carboxylating nicotinate-nucleotide diphosphorylase [Alphaproteobacteria bacterium]
MVSVVITPPPSHLIDEAIRLALAEDLGLAGDITTAATISEAATTRAVIAARKPGAIAGVAVARRVFELFDPTVQVNTRIQDGAKVKPGDVVLEIRGASRSILSAERVALNFIGHLSGIATATAEIAGLIAHTKAKVCCTRKTTPGLRALEKYAVRCGGGVNHRFGLFDAVLIKDNHIAAAGGVAKAIHAAQRSVGHTVKIEVEVDTIEQLNEALAAGADILLLDNMTPAQLAEAVKIVGGRAVTEASGSITKATAAAIAESGVDLISVGWITHSAPCLDLGLDFI